LIVNALLLFAPLNDKPSFILLTFSSELNLVLYGHLQPIALPHEGRVVISQVLFLSRASSARFMASHHFASQIASENVTGLEVVEIVDGKKPETWV